MLYTVKYGKKWLRRGRLVDKSPAIYFHPSSAKKAAASFESRNPDYVGKGTMFGFVKGLEASRVRLQ